MLMRHRALAAAAAAALALVAAGREARAEELNGRAIAERLDRENRPKDEVDRFTMVIVSPTGQKRTRQLTTWFKAGESSDDRTLVRFDAPPDVKGTGMLTIEKGDDDEQWLYLPELRKKKRIAGASKALSFMGTDFSNYDMRTEDLAGHDYERVADEKMDGRDCYVVIATPKDDEVKDETGYSKRKIWVDKERWVVLRCEYFDKNGKLLKVATQDEFEKVEGLWRPKRTTMENVQEKSKTIVLHDRGREVNKGIEDSMFTTRRLEQP